MLLLTLIGSVSSLVMQQSKNSMRQTQLVQAYQFADGGVSIATNDLNRAFTTNPDDLAQALTTDLNHRYRWDLTLSSSDENCYTRQITAPFVNQVVTAQIWLKADHSTETARIVAIGQSGPVSQTTTAHVMMSYGFGAALISTAAGNDDSTASKSSAQAGNLALILNASDHIQGGTIANGSANYNSEFTPEISQISDQKFGSEDQIPNYTNSGSSNQLFNFDRYIAVGQAMGTHYTSVADFQRAVKDAHENVPGYLEGIIVIDIGVDDDDITSYGNL